MSTNTTNRLITTPVAAIIITSIICITFLFAVGRFDKPIHDYATVNFDGGYQKIGVISEQRYFSNIEIVFNDSVLWSGEIGSVVSSIRQSLKAEKTPLEVTWKDGVIVKGNAGIKWVGSENTFRLTTEDIDMLSTKENPLSPVQVIAQLEKIERDLKDSHETHAQQALSFSAAPNASFTLNKIMTALSKI
ncbi:hypothetical protein [Photobacterium leiognathi]|uniref:Uncharacterized protein n=1 Tax=Photobacterium leiognathi TaxID=553611 RepID=A0ABX5GK59_PHOLE|nr:hypothetical protein [Photobacterium leiognathi]KJF89041.1 hypothetical protein UB42_15240 [Photobacterium leiognathi]PSV86248.1 hypothetical protein CTM94_00065 [Photobacterium leiognathi]